MDKNFIVQEANRLDKFLASQIDASRNQIEQLIKKEFVKVDGKTVNSMCKEFSKTMDLPMDQVLVKYIDGEFSELYADLV